MTYYLIDNRLVGVKYPSASPQWVPRGFTFAPLHKRQKASIKDSWGEELTSSRLSKDADMSKEVKGYYDKAKAGDAKAQYDFACCLSEGDGIKQDQKEALFWFKCSAENGYRDAIYNLAYCYDEGDGVNRNKAKAIHYYTIAGNKGDCDAAYNLGIMYYTGEGGKKNYPQAVYWLKKASLSQDYSVKAGALWVLAACYEYGYGVRKNIREANRLKQESDKYEKKAAEQEF